MPSKIKLKEILLDAEGERAGWRDRFAGALLVVALILLSFLLDFIVYNILEAIYGAKTLYLMEESNPMVEWLLDNLWLPIFHIFILIVLSMPLWRDHPLEKIRASIFFSATLLLYFLWGFVLEGFESPILLHLGGFLLYFVPLFHAILASNIRYKMKGA